ncbi:MAG: hypothetical protein WC346_10145 [Methanogenium sp.]|jgi:hypothetical protein
MKKDKDDFVQACEIYWGEWTEVDVYNVLMEETPHRNINWDMSRLQAEGNPESILMEKDMFNSLPRECRILAEILVNLPEEMFLVNGKVKKTSLRKLVKKQTGWPIEKVDRIQARLGTCLLRSAIP